MAENFMKQLADPIIEQLKRGEAPWQKKLDENVRLAANPVSNMVYSGLNQVLLSSHGHLDSRWMTIKQANSKGIKVKKGEKGQRITFWQYEEDGKQLDRPRLKYVSVFHASQLSLKNGQDLAAEEGPGKGDANRQGQARAVDIIGNFGVPLLQDVKKGQRPYYDSQKDELHTFSLDDVEDMGFFYQSALKGLVHATAHPDRLNRKSGPPGTPAFALEELRAQMAAWMISRELGLPFEPVQNEAYSKEWVKALDADPYELARAARDAEKIKEYVLAMELVQNKAVEKEPVAEAAPQPAAEKTFLAVPFKDKDEAKTLGARWDGQAKLWYAPEGADMSKLGRWKPENEPVPAKTMSPEDEFAQALSHAGFKLNGPPVMDGKIHRVAVEGGKSGSLDGAYCGYLDGRPNGWMQNYKTGEKNKWLATGHTLTDEQRAAMKAEAAQRAAAREKERTQGYAKAMSGAAEKMEAAVPVQEHGYLAAKGVKAYGLKQDDQGNLLLPAYDISTDPPTLQTIQSITAEGVKFFEKGCPKKGAMLIIDAELKLGSGSEILIAEGYATGASLHQATGKIVAVAFDSGNLLPVAEKLREKYPETDIAVCADNDHKQAKNVGLEKAEEAARAVDGRVIVPLFTELEKSSGLTDFNDLHRSRGLEAVKNAVMGRETGKGIKSIMEHTWMRLGEAAQAVGFGR